MATPGLLQLTPKLGICRNRKSSEQLKYPFRRGKLHLPATNLPSISVGQDLLIHHISESIKRPICCIPLRYNSLYCRSSLLSDSHATNSCLKTVITALTRSYNYVQGSPSIIKLTAAVGLVVFTLWGLVPLVRSSRNLLLHKNENSWRKSTTHYVLTSYLQPALLWTGAMLVCRALDPVVMPTEASHLVKLRVLNFIRSLSTVLSFAYCLSCAIQHSQKVFTQRSDTSDTRNMGFQFAAKTVYSAVWVAAISLFMELLGFSTQKWLTAGGLGTVVLTLAGREIFTNFLSSAMIHATRPFLMNEWIQTKIEGYEVSGTVEQVGWWSPTIIRGEDREAIHIPNHKFTVNIVRNLSQKTHWRIKTHLAISHLDVSKINNIVADMRKVLAKNPQVEQQKLHRRVFFDKVDPENQALLILVSCFVKTSRHEEYLCVKESVLLDLLRVINHHRARLATPIRTIQKIYYDADIENVPFAEPVFSRSRPTSNRPFLLIEPSNKVNGEERAKPPRSRRAGGDQESQATGQQQKSDSKVDAKLKGKSASESKSVETSKSSNKIETSTATSLDKTPNLQGSQLSSKVDNVVSSESGNKKTNGPSLVNSQSNHSEKKASATQASATVEENIVLGVALEGSKRTLPIDDDRPGLPPPVEAKEAAANQKSSESGKETSSENYEEET